MCQVDMLKVCVLRYIQCFKSIHSKTMSRSSSFFPLFRCTMVKQQDGKYGLPLIVSIDDSKVEKILKGRADLIL